MIFIIGLLIIGIILLVLEILVLPGMIAGIVGGIFLLAGIFWMYKTEGTLAGNITLISTFAATAIVIYASLKSKAWSRFGLKSTIEGKVNEVNLLDISEGVEGKTISALRPSGTIMIGDLRVEAHTNGEYIDTGTRVVVTRVLQNKVMVKIKVTEL